MGKKLLRASDEDLQHTVPVRKSYLKCRRSKNRRAKRRVLEFRASEKFFQWKEKVLERDREGMREREEVEVEVARFMTSADGKVQGNALRVEANVRRNAGVGVRSVHPRIGYVNFLFRTWFRE